LRLKLLTISVLLGASALLIESCASSHKPAGNSPAATTAQISLFGTEWSLIDLAGSPALANVQATLAFPEAGRVAGNGSCNRFTGTVLIAGNSLKIGPLASTRMACTDNGASAQEDKYLAILGAATRYAYQEPDLLIYAEGYDKPLRFTRASAIQP
jgi:heat shock protein HslJ